MTDPNPTPTVPVAPGTSAPVGNVNESTPPVTTSALTLEEINRSTGRSYATLDAALAGIGETFRHVGAKPIVVEKVVEKVPENMVSREEFAESNFFRDTPAANKHRDLLASIAKANGMTPQALFAADPATNPAAKLFHDTVGGLKVAEETAGTRSALTSSSRLGIIGDSATKAKEAFENSQKARMSGDVVTANRLQREAETQALDAVIKAFPNLTPNGGVIVD